MKKKELNEQKPIQEATQELSDEALDTVAGGGIPLYHTERPEKETIVIRRKPQG